MRADIVRFSLLVMACSSIAQGSAVSIEQQRLATRRAKSDEIHKYMNTSVDPCEDFYEFTCGNYAKYNPASYPDHRETGTFMTLLTEFWRKTKLLLKSVEETDTLADKQVKKVYSSCLKLSSLKKDEELRSLASEFGQMPALLGDAWQEQDFDWLEVVGRIAYKYKVHILLSVDVNTDLYDKRVNAIYLNEQYFNLARTLYLDPKHEPVLEMKRALYGIYLNTYLGMESKLADQLGIEFVEIEKSLAKGLYDKQLGLSLQEIAERGTIEEMQQRYAGTFSLERLLNTTLGTVPKLQVIASKSYMEELVRVLQETPKRTLANYIFFRLFTAFVHLPEKRMSQEAICDHHMKTYFVESLVNMFYRRYIGQDKVKAFNDMWLNIKKAFHKVLESDSLLWITEATRKYALTKLEAMEFLIISYEERNFEEELAHLQLDADNYISNLKMVFASRAHLSRALNYAVPKPIPTVKQSIETAVYIKSENKIHIPVSALQPDIMWDIAFPNAYNFAQLGFLIAHELLHGYDGNGRTFDAHGNIEDKWWQEDPLDSFQERSNCFMAQYHQYLYGNQHLPAMNNQNENIADNGGIRLAYLAYNSWYEEAIAIDPSYIRDLESLEGLNYNRQQLFFIGYGQVWCQDMLEEAKLIYLQNDNHTPKPFRVIGPLANMQEFSEEFHCPKDSFMNPTKKCVLY